MNQYAASENQKIIHWLLSGDVSIQYQVWRDLFGVNKKKLQQRTASEGWGAQILAKQKPNGEWGDGFYQPKWTCTHYTLLDLRNLNLAPNRHVKQSIASIVNQQRATDGGIRLGPSTAQRSDVCVNGMFLNYAAYFQTPESKLHPIVDVILAEKMPDGGFNCRTTRSGARHSSLHSTLSVLEGFTEFQNAGFTYRAADVQRAIASSVEFILAHHLFLSRRTGEVIDQRFLRLSYPCRWRYDIFRAMDFFRYTQLGWDNRMNNALLAIREKQNKDGTWNMQAPHPGRVHITMEPTGKPSRWNTLRMLRVLKHFNEA